MRVLVLGAGGMLAHDLIATAPRGIELIAKTRAELDVTDQGQVLEAQVKYLPHTIINCAAYTDVDGAERNPERAIAVNATALEHLVLPARAPEDQLIVHFSTDYVFDGKAKRPYTEGRVTRPLGAYGASKLAGEQVIRQSGRPFLLIRTSWLFGAHGRSFPRTMWERGRRGEPTRVVNDQVGRPTYTADLARAFWILHERRARGVVHVANRGHATWFDVADRVFELAGDADLLTPCTTAEYPTPARRPAYSVLSTRRFEKLTGVALPPWEDAIDRFVEELEGGSPPPGAGLGEPALRLMPPGWDRQS